MTEQEIIDEIKEVLTGGILELEMEDKDIALLIKNCLREVNRYWDEEAMMTIPFASCIDLSKSELDLNEKVSTVIGVYRTTSVGDSSPAAMGDPMFMQQWMLFSNGGTMYNLNDYALNYAAWNTLLQIKNTMTTDLSWTIDKHANKLYINNYMNTPSRITVKYIPVIKKAEDIKSDYWIDIVVKMSLAMTKIALGRIRTFSKQTNALWELDGDKLLEEGNTELKEIRELLRTNSNLIYGID